MNRIHKILLAPCLLLNFLYLVSMDSGDLINEELAKTGHVESMVPIIKKELSLAGIYTIRFIKLENLSSSQAEHLKMAGQWFARYYIRILQDVACCCKKAEMNEFMESYLEKQDFAKTISQCISKAELNKMYLEQISWVEQRTINQELPEPRWIERYSWDSLQEFPVQILISKNKWQEKRAAELNALKNELQEK